MNFLNFDYDVSPPVRQSSYDCNTRFQKKLGRMKRYLKKMGKKLGRMNENEKPHEIKEIRTLKDIANNIEHLRTFFSARAKFVLLSDFRDDAGCRKADCSLEEYLHRAEKVNDLIEKEFSDKKVLELEQRGLTTIPQPLSKFTQLESLDLQENKIRQIENLENLKNLNMLNLGLNEITDLSPIFEHNTNLTELHVLDNPITSLKGIENLKKLHFLDIADTKIPLNELERLKELEHLIVLHVSKDQIAPARIFAAKNKLEWRVYEYEDRTKRPLKSKKGKNLVLQDLSLKEIPKEIEELEDLRSLYLDENEINDLSPLFHYNKNIETLYIADNPIATLEGIENLQNLRVLNIANTEVTDLEPLKKLKNLELLVVSDDQVVKTRMFAAKNKLSWEAANSVQKFEKIEAPAGTYLMLDNLSLEKIPEELKEFDELTWVNLSSRGKIFPNANRITRIENLEHLHNLKRLELGHNNIPDLSPVFSHNTELDEMRVNHNPVRSIEGIERLTKLRGLDLSYTEIFDLTPLKHLKSLNHLVVSQNQAEQAKNILGESNPDCKLTIL